MPVLLYLGIFSLMLPLLFINVVRFRFKTKTSLGDGGHEELIKARAESFEDLLEHGLQGGFHFEEVMLTGQWCEIQFGGWNGPFQRTGKRAVFGERRRGFGFHNCWVKNDRWKRHEESRELSADAHRA